MSSNIYAADQFDKTDPAGTESPSDLDTLITTNNNVLDRLLADYREGCDVVYASATTLTVGAGQICCDNAARSLRRWRENTSSTNVTFSDLDVGSEAAGTYYIWAVADTDVSTFTCTISASSSAPTNKTYYALLGSFTNDAGLDITASSVVDYAATAVGDGSITTAKLADLAVTNAKIAATTIDLTTKVTGLLPVANVTTVTTATASSIPKLDASGYITAFYETYDSGWFSVALNTSYTKTHGLGTTKILMQVWYSADSGGSSAELVYMNFNSGGGQSAGCWTNTLSTTTVKINSGQYDLTSRGYSGITWGGTATSVATTGYYRVIAIALE